MHDSPTRRSLSDLTLAERFNFLVTNRIPRHALTVAMGRFSRVENPLVRSASIACWRLFADDLRLFEAKKQRFDSLHDCFIRELKPGVRPIDPDPAHVVSPCDAVLGAHGPLRGREALQAKGFPYSVEELLGGDTSLAQRLRDGTFVTLRLKSSMYHRFHAPLDACLERLTYVSGDTWNVNPIALRVVERLFCRNERVILELGTGLPGAPTIVLVAVAAVLVASVRIHGLSMPLDLGYRGPNRIELERSWARGEEIGYFEHGSTIVMLAPAEFQVCDKLLEGAVIRVGEPLLRFESATEC